MLCVRVTGGRGDGDGVGGAAGKGCEVERRWMRAKYCTWVLHAQMLFIFFVYYACGVVDGRNKMSLRDDFFHFDAVHASSVFVIS